MTAGTLNYYHFECCIWPDLCWDWRHAFALARPRPQQDVAHHTSQTIDRVPPRLALHQLQQVRQALQVKLPVVFGQQVHRHVMEFALGQIPKGFGQHQQLGASPGVQPGQAT